MGVSHFPKLVVNIEHLEQKNKTKTPPNLL